MSIICGTDLSERSRGALEVARALAVQRGEREVVLVYVAEKEEPAARAALDAQVAAAAGTTPVRAELVVGTPEVSLTAFADTEGSDLIVIAASSEPTSLLKLGSTA